MFYTPFSHHRQFYIEVETPAEATDADLKKIYRIAVKFLPKQLHYALVEMIGYYAPSCPANQVGEGIRSRYAELSALRKRHFLQFLDLALILAEAAKHQNFSIYATGTATAPKSA